LCYFLIICLFSSIIYKCQAPMKLHSRQLETVSQAIPSCMYRLSEVSVPFESEGKVLLNCSTTRPGTIRWLNCTLENSMWLSAMIRGENYRQYPVNAPWGHLHFIIFFTSVCARLLFSSVSLRRLHIVISHVIHIYRS
jgi:hypothetical protein